MRIGYGFDVHAFGQERPLVIGGVRIPDHAGLSGYSDADVLCHAIGDALLGAAALGDLGTHFPETERWRDSSSLEILAEVSQLLKSSGIRIGNVDATIVCETPRIGPYREEMIARVAGALDVDMDCISVKATSTDGLGFTGRGEGIAAHAVALIAT